MASWLGAPLEGTQGLKDSSRQVFCPPGGAPTPQGRSPKHPSPFLGAGDGHSITPTKS